MYMHVACISRVMGWHRGGGREGGRRVGGEVGGSWEERWEHSRPIWKGFGKSGNV